MGSGGCMIKDHSRTIMKRHGNQKTLCVQEIINSWVGLGHHTERRSVVGKKNGKVKIGQWVCAKGGMLTDICSTLLMLIKDFK